MTKIYILTDFSAQLAESNGVDYLLLESSDEMANMTAICDRLTQGSEFVIVFSDAKQFEMFYKFFSTALVDVVFVSDLLDAKVLSLNPAFDGFILSHTVLDITSISRGHNTDAELTNGSDKNTQSSNDSVDKEEISTIAVTADDPDSVTFDEFLDSIGKDDYSDELFEGMNE